MPQEGAQIQQVISNGDAFCQDRDLNPNSNPITNEIVGIRKEGVAVQIDSLPEETLGRFQDDLGDPRIDHLDSVKNKDTGVSIVKLGDKYYKIQEKYIIP